MESQILEHGQTREKRMRSQNKHFSLEDDPVHNDFMREMSFYRQAQATVLEGYSKLENLGLPTVRPADYFAEMAKSDDHMQKVGQVPVFIFPKLVIGKILCLVHLTTMNNTWLLQNK